MKRLVLGLIIVLGSGSIYLFNNCARTSSATLVTAHSLAQAEQIAKKLSIDGDSGAGIFDPSITKDPATGRLWMSYSSVNPSPQFPSANDVAPHTRLAYSVDNGQSWVDIGAVNQISDVILPLPPPNHAGTWVNEVSSLVYDPGAPITQKWKLVWHTFLKINGVPRFEHSWIAIKVASTPEGLLAAVATKLFASYFYDAGNNSAASPTHPPIPTAPAIQIDTAIAGMSTCLVSEPALFARAGALYLALQCEKFNDPVDPNDDDRLITLLRCLSPCYLTSPAGWTNLGTLFTRAQSVAVEPSFNGGYVAPALVETPNGVHLIVTPSEEPGALYRGCSVFKFTDLDAGQLDKTLVAKIEGSKDKFRGACGYHADATSSGVFLSELSSLPDGEFQIFLSHIPF